MPLLDWSERQLSVASFRWSGVSEHLSDHCTASSRVVARTFLADSIIFIHFINVWLDLVPLIGPCLQITEHVLCLVHCERNVDFFLDAANVRT